MKTIKCLIFHLLIFSVLCVLVKGFGRPSPPRSGVNHLQQELKKFEQIGAKLGEEMEVLSEQINDLICKNGSANVTTVKRSLQPTLTSMQGQSSNSQKQPMQQQQYYPSNTMMNSQMGKRITNNAQQPMSAYSQNSNLYSKQSGYGQSTGQSQMIKRQQQQSRPIQAHSPPQRHQQYGNPEQHPVYEPPQYYDNIGWGENVPDSYEPVGGPYAYDDYAEEQDMGGDDNIEKREVK
ncbi:unnamed protein product [Schistosoma rodhaini]|uniref:DUF1421 domain-containing protein n=1 Tax=Schistosoma rodhaini TaxID=6188 RepID=A0AA85GDD5_9TREM|nr:unnamed protein product [Schistosoma rodhaini]